MKKDKLDQALTELSGKRMGECTRCGGDLTADHICPSESSENPTKNTLGTRDTYLPYILVTLGLFPSNGVALMYIIEKGVILNGKECHDPQATAWSENFTVSVPEKDEREFFVFKDDELTN